MTKKISVEYAKYSVSFMQDLSLLIELLAKPKTISNYIVEIEGINDLLAQKDAITLQLQTSEALDDKNAKLSDKLELKKQSLDEKEAILIADQQKLTALINDNATQARKLNALEKSYSKKDSELQEREDALIALKVELDTRSAKLLVVESELEQTIKAYKEKLLILNTI